MALIPCYECNRQISDMAEACPQCGAPGKPPESAVGQQSPRGILRAPWPAFSSAPGAGAVYGAAAGLGVGITLISLVFGVNRDETKYLLLMMVTAAFFSIVGAVIGWAVCKRRTA